MLVREKLHTSEIQDNSSKNLMNLAFGIFYHNIIVQRAASFCCLQKDCIYNLQYERAHAGERERDANNAKSPSLLLY